MPDADGASTSSLLRPRVVPPWPPSSTGELGEGKVFAHQVVEYAGPDALEWNEVAEPEPGSDGEVLVDVVAAGVSFADLLQTRGEYQLKPPLPFSPGMDATGVVRWASKDTGLEIGQRVVVLLRYGCWQEVVVARREHVLPLPDDSSFESGVALALNSLTALFALETRGGVVAGETLLVHGAAGGVGTAAVQLGRTLGLRTIAVVSDETKRSFALECGAHEAVLVDDWPGALQDVLGKRAVDIVFDPVGGDRFTDNLRCLAPGGRVLVVGFAAGTIPEVKTNRLLLANIGVLGAASLEYFESVPAARATLWEQLLRLRRAGALPSPPVESFLFADARGALRAVAERRSLGKVVLTRDDSG